MKTPHTHVCMRCNESFECLSPLQCAAGPRVLPSRVVETTAGIETSEHCPKQPDWTWINAYAARQAAAAREEGRREGIEQAAALCEKEWGWQSDKALETEPRADGAWENTDNEHTHKAWACENLEQRIRALASQPKPAKDPQRTADYMARMAPLETVSGFADTKPEPERTLTGEAAREFLAEMKRIENLPRDSEEYLAREAFLEECRRIYETDRQKLTKHEPAVTCEGCKRGLPQTLRLGVLSHYDMDARPQFTRCTK